MREPLDPEYLADLVSVLDELTHKQLEDVRLYAISRAVGTAAMMVLAGPEANIFYSKRYSTLCDWGLVDPLSHRRTTLGARLAREFKPAK